MPRRVWPPHLERVVLRTGYAESVGTQLERHQPQTGPALVRRRVGKRPDVTTGTLLFDRYDDFLAFCRWFEDVESGLAGGLYVVEWTHPITKKTLKIRFVPESEERAFTGQPHGSTAFAWEVPVTLEILP